MSSSSTPVHILSREKLSTYSARPLTIPRSNPTTPNDTNNNNNPGAIKQDVIKTTNTDKNENEVYGISIQSNINKSSENSKMMMKVDIETCAKQIIANESEVDVLTTQLQQQTHPNYKRLNTPEILFNKSFVLITFSLTGTKINNNDEELEGENKKAMELKIKLDPVSSLMEWADAHKYLDDNNYGDEGTSSNNIKYTGVSVLKTQDAALWQQKQKKEGLTTTRVQSLNKKLFEGKFKQDGGNFQTKKTTQPEQHREFNFDWTFSSPYTCSIIQKEENNDNGRQPSWEPLDSSGIQPKLYLLKDQTQPILFFREIPFYEDDLHDNGISHSSVKIRVMPTCFYILFQLYIRVDYVLLRVRETRIFHEFSSSKIYRDVSWREAKWDDLYRAFGLPCDIRCWRIEQQPTSSPSSNACSSSIAASVSNQQQQQMLQSLIGRLPLVKKLPDNIPSHSFIKIC